MGVTATAAMPAIASGEIAAFFLFDVAETADLSALGALLGDAATATRLPPHSGTPAYVQYQVPPLALDGARIGLAEVEGFRARLKIFDYGVVSLALVRPFAGSWPALLEETHRLDHDVLERRAEQCCRTLLERIGPVLTRPRTHLLVEDYTVVVVHEFERPIDAEALVQSAGDTVAQLLLGERERLSDQERAEVLRHRISFLTVDLVIPTWSAAFLYDRRSGAEAALDIIEFANSQLLQFRYYDHRLDQELDRIYADLQARRWYDIVSGRRYTSAARRLHSVFIEVSELTDRTENALKFVGDVYAARLFGLVAGRLGLDGWKQRVREKLETLDTIYRFAVEQTAMSRGEVLELMIVLILVFELILFFLGIMD